MVRLTIKNNDGSYSQPTHTTFNKLFDKLSKFEDVIEKYDIESVEELDERLGNAIVPRFKIGQKVWWIDKRVNSFNEQRDKIESYLIDSIVMTKEQFRYYGNDALWLGDEDLFATEQEARKRLEELNGE